MTLGKNIISGIAIAVVILLVILAGKNVLASGNDITGKVVSEKVNLESYNGEYQEATLKMEGYNYVLEPSTLIKDVPVRMTVDLETVYGCMRDVVISAFDVRQTVNERNNVIEFVPDRTGKIPVVCSMNMGQGSFTVVDSQGNTNPADQKQIDSVVASAPSTSSCGGSGSCGGSCGA